MTNEQAIKIIMDIMRVHHLDTMRTRLTDEALSMAIEALRDKVWLNERCKFEIEYEKEN